MPSRFTFIIVVILLSLTALWFGGCASSSEQRPPDSSMTDAPPPPTTVPVGDLPDQVYVDLAERVGDDWRPAWTPSVPEEARFDLNKARDAKKAEAVAASDQPEMTQGFRVQLGDVLSEAQANQIKERGLELFDHVYIEFRSPNYKIRAGDFTRRIDAQRPLDTARGAGFRDAWIVPDWVLVNPPPPERAKADSTLLDGTLVPDPGP